VSLKFMTWTFEHSPYTLGARLVHLALADSANDDYGGLLWSTQGTIAKKAGVSRATANSVLQRMVGDGWLGEATEQEVATIRALMKDPRAKVYRFVTCQISDTSDGATCQDDEADVSSSPARCVESTGSRLLPTQEQPNGNARGLPVPSMAQAFEEWWLVYPRHVGKQAAHKAYDRALVNVSPARLIEAAERFRDDPNREDRFTPHPTTWLNQGRWDDDPLPPRNGSRQGNPVRRDGSGGVSLLDLAADHAEQQRRSHG
jgi:hypothetical protein